MTVQELIEELQGYNPDMEVNYRVPSHDYWGTELSYEVDRVEVMDVKHSDYHNSMALATDSDYEHDEDEEKVELKEVLLLN
jgi:hypothetical protein